MDKEKLNIHIIGAGVSGLIAAKVLEDQGFYPIVLEATDRPGGRVKTDFIKGYQLDHGFQVLLSSYPAAQKYLDYDALQLQKFKSGSYLFKNGKQKIIGDPLRDITVLFSTLFSGIGTLSDKFKILSLNLKLKKKSIEDIFASKESTTISYLRDFGFSEGIISDFFRPFFTGIFLETDLETSSRMFEFVFKMFGSGQATLPKGGIEEITKQLTTQLQKTSFHFNSKVSKLTDQLIQLENGEEVQTDYTILATDPSFIIHGSGQKPIEWKSCQTLYFSCPKRLYTKPYIGLVMKKECLINNIFYHNSLQTKEKGKGELLSVTIVQKHSLSKKDLISRVTQELQEQCGIRDVSFIKMYDIPKALPNIKDLKYESTSTRTRWSDHIFLAGDSLLNGSLNAAMLAGEKAALELVAKVDSL